MANEIKNQEFNKHIKQLQSMIGDKQIITLAENYYNLKVEMTALIRSVKEKENSLIAKKKAENIEIKKEEEPSIVSEPKVEVELVEPVKPVEEKPKVQQPAQQQNFDRNKQNNFANRNQNPNNRPNNFVPGAKRPFVKPGQNNQQQGQYNRNGNNFRQNNFNNNGF